MDFDSNNFMKALHDNDLELLKKVAKSDLHNHATRGANKRYIENWAKVKIPSCPIFTSLVEMQNWYNQNIKVYTSSLEGLIIRLKGAFKQAVDDGIGVLCLSFGSGDKVYFDNDIKKFISAIEAIRNEIAPNINFIPEISLARSLDEGFLRQQEIEFNEILALNYFKSVDLVGDDSLPVTPFIDIYQNAKKCGLITRAHLGEFASYDHIIEACNILNLDEINHGINASKSNEVMNYLSKTKIVLNICPSSNVLLSRCTSYETHPLRVLLDNEVVVTINSDDMLIFDNSISDEFLNLYKSGLYTVEELNQIRLNGIRYNLPNNGL